ncbi:MAG: PQQ-binding-like beta-propeller repeat protein [Kiritimatiellia bacterium]
MKMRLGWIAMVLIGTAATGGEFAKQPVGPAGGWAGTIAGAVLDGTLYTVEAAGKLYATDPADGSWTQLGDADFANTAFLFAAGGSLVSIEKDGTLYLINPRDGSWMPSGPSGGWANTIAGAALDGTLYTVESSGTLYATDPAAGTWQAVGRPDFAATKFLFAAARQLVSIESTGSLYLINPTDGSRKQIGEAGAWADTVAGAVHGNVLYTAETDGNFHFIHVADGIRTLSGADAAGIRFLFAVDGVMCGIDADGDLFRWSDDEGPGSAEASTTAPPAPSTAEDEAQNNPARAGALTFQLMGQWVGDVAPLEQDPEFLKQKAAAPEMVQQVVDLMRGMKMSVTLDGIAMEVMGETAGPFAYSVVAGHDDVLVIEMDAGPKQGTRSRITFRDPKHLQVEELTPDGRAMFFLKP